MVILAVDYGDVRTGLAVCDKNEMLASPLTVITESDPQRLCEKIVDEIKKAGAGAAVVGLPLNMDGSHGPRAQKADDFSKMLAESAQIPVALFDERCTTMSAARELNFTDTRGKKRKKVIDALSAVLILEGYMATRKN